jgi:hypothetical protein
VLGPVHGAEDVQLRGFKGEFATPHEAVEADLKTDLKNSEELTIKKERSETQDGLEKSKYTVARNDKVIAQYFVEERPEGGYEVGATQLCAEEQKPDPAQP